jgi:hypothetical protein
MHYGRWQRTGNTDKYEYVPPTCTVDGCATRAKSRGMCGRHYQQWKAHGAVRPDLTPTEAFWARVERTGHGGCWLWTGSTSNGYGIIKWAGRGSGAHRVAWEIAFGAIPDDREIDHRCHTSDCRLGAKCPHRRCVNPSHLKPVTHAENMAPDRSSLGASSRERNRAKTHCPHGHEYTPENTYFTPSGSRYCRECNRAAARVKPEDRVTVKKRPVPRKLTDEQVAEIRSRLAGERISQTRLAAEYGVSQALISQISRGKSRI